ncbi:flagellar biosynthesis protein FlhA [Carboxydothermus islandicus]|uniref:Flagellar biosynthesis protein FlhA n=1 Tax=Carboxydothermus islandicus TaxID=661089 RepID=A0A1L8D4S6_9THEO|nr:flagellar biosynthesis protein FlhA [Carboxydothermus islandicus]GAV26173.1 flagellar biosynthesis protein FlhA [Carboxydothermus islandicus]
MATVSKGNTFLKNNYDLIVAGFVILTLVLIIIPLPPFMLDILLVFSITFSLVILLITLFTTEPLQFSIFPTLLLVMTLYRLALNISSTRLILSQASAGQVIQAFGSFVVGGSYVVGFVVFLIITVIQFVVITNGAGRVAEVAARFTLDAMPGKQMAIDAEFNAGLITEQEARQKRRKLQREADFFGAMDGASKFVRGDAIAGIVILLINILGGLLIGVIQLKMPVLQALQTYTVLTIGDGLVSQIPALLISTATGILVTRASADENFGREFTKQVGAFPKVLIMAAIIIFLLGLIPAMPNLLFISLAGLLGYGGYLAVRYTGQVKDKAQPVVEVPKKREPENVLNYFNIDPLEIEIGYNLITLTDETQGGDLLGRLAAVRRQLALELGLYVRPIRIRDNLQLPPNQYVFKLRGAEAEKGELLPGYVLVLDPTGEKTPEQGIPTREPAFGLEAWWVRESQKANLEIEGFTVIEPSAVLVTHLTEFIKKNAAEILGRQEVKELLETLRQNQPAVVEEVYPELLTIGEIQKVLQSLLKENVSIRDLTSILEALADAVRQNRDPDFLIEQVRQKIRRQIVRQYLHEGKLYAVTLTPQWEQQIAESLQPTSLGIYPLLDTAKTEQFIEKVKQTLTEVTRRGLYPVIITSSRVRLPLRRLLDRFYPQAILLGINEIPPDIEVEILGTVN